jgi:hypothetical protein
MTDPAGAGGATGYSPFTTPENSGKGGSSPPHVFAVPGQAGFGGGGGGGAGPGGPGSGIGGNGGSGTVVVRYQIGTISGTAKATGGAISFAGGKTVHTFVASDTFTVTNSGLTSVEYVVVGGGGAGGGSSRGGGGGAGGFRTNIPGTPRSISASYPVSPGSYSVIVGGGGASTKAQKSLSAPQDGSDSQFGPPSSDVFATGGGGGGNRGTNSARPGGSGGGGGSGPGSGSKGNTVASPDSLSPTAQGYAGGDASQSAPIYGGGGGGGAGAAGGDGSSTSGGDGGDGIQVTVGGVATYYAGGGGGGSYSNPGPGTEGDGGQGGGGQGGYGNNHFAASPMDLQVEMVDLVLLLFNIQLLDN